MRNHGRYILNEAGEPELCDDLHRWRALARHGRGHIGDDKFDGVRVSTVFLGLDHAFDGGPPVLWETMIFGGKCDEYQERYTSKADAMAGHTRAVEMAKEKA